MQLSEFWLRFRFKASWVDHQWRETKPGPRCLHQNTIIFLLVLVTQHLRVNRRLVYNNVESDPVQQQTFVKATVSLSVSLAVSLAISLVISLAISVASRMAEEKLVWASWEKRPF